MKDYRFVDWATQIYLAVVGLMILLWHGENVPTWKWLVASHVVVMALIHLLIRCASRGHGGATVRFLRAFYPIILYTGLYRETGLTNHMLVQGFLDPVFMRWDQAWFGCQPCLVWMQLWPQRIVAEFLYLSYFSYYFMVAGVGLALLIRNRAQFSHFISVVSFAFYCCYFIYTLLPVLGPRIFDSGHEWPVTAAETARPPLWGVLTEPPPPYPESVTRAWFYQIVAFLYRHFEAEGAAFPSSHVALALVTLYFSWRYLPRVRWIHLVLAIGLCTATVYCRYHYLVDVLAGILTAALLLPLANYLYRRIDCPAGMLPEPERTGSR